MIYAVFFFGGFFGGIAWVLFWQWLHGRDSTIVMMIEKRDEEAINHLKP